ncbi:hypothetical protein LTR33_005897 [Friedmanniomyces endolithicus]|nr:hypothetical protein LTR33_005897 [Friedmanniomyces endolithicus]
MASLTTNNNAMEMQYKPAEPMQASPSTAAQENAPTTDCESQQPKKERTFLGMRGGGILRAREL